MEPSNDDKRFAEFTSASSVPRLQPDPFVLRELDKRVKEFTNLAETIHLSPGFILAIAEHFFEAFRRLDAIDRDNPFWEGTNRRPTPFKLYSVCELLLRRNPMDREALWLKAAVAAVVGMSFNSDAWERLASSTSVDRAWIVEAAAYAEDCGTADDMSVLVGVLRRMKACSGAIARLDAMRVPRAQDCSDEWIVRRNRHLADWANRVLDAYAALR